MCAKLRLLPIFLVLFLLGLGSTALPLQAAQSDDDKSVQVDVLFTQLTARSAFSGSVLIAYNGSVLLDKGYGLANRDWNIPNAPDTKFRIASITKQFTAMSILMLQEQGKLSVNDLICQYLDNCPQAWAGITVQNLLNHTSGIPELLSMPDIQAIQGQSLFPNQLLSKFNQLPLDFQPNQGWSYSNSGYDVLGQIIAKVSNEAYPRFLKANIFDSLEMKNTIYDLHNAVVANRAVGYNGALLADPIDTSVLYSAGGLYSTVDDLYKWDQALYSGKVISEQSWNAMLAAAIPIPDSVKQAFPDVETYAYGLAIGKTGSHPEIGHPGGVNGFSSSIEHLQDTDFTIIILSNFETADTNTLSDLAVQTFFGTS